MNTTDDVDKKMKALADSTRLRIMEMIKHRPLCAGDISKEFHNTEATISYHLHYLKKLN